MSPRAAAICLVTLSTGTAMAADDLSPRPVMIHPVLVDGKPVWNGGADAVIVGLKAKGDGYLSVRASPTTKAREIDRIANGRYVMQFPGDPQAEKNNFIGIVYLDSPEAPGPISIKCAIPGDFYDGPYKGPCKSGWVSWRFVQVHAD